MRQRGHNPGMRWLKALSVLALSGIVSASRAQSPQQAAPQKAVQSAPQGVVMDRVVAVVNDKVILESDVDEEQRFEAIQPYRGSVADFTREQALQRLINRLLIKQQADVEQPIEINDKDVDDQLVKVRRDIPACKEYHCETDAGWERFLAAHGFTVKEFRDRWRERMELLRFVEVRFQSGIRVTDEEIQQYYEKTMLPEYQRMHATPPPLSAISNRVEEVLMQQQVSNLLVDWLNSLRVQGSVRIINQDEARR